MKSVSLFALALLFLSCSKETSEQAVVPVILEETIQQKVLQEKPPLTPDDILASDYHLLDLYYTLESNIMGKGDSTLYLLYDFGLKYSNDGRVFLEKLLVYDQEKRRMIEHPFSSLDIANLTYMKYLDWTKDLADDLGEWHEFFYLYDFNKNGIDELWGFRMTGISFLPEVWEFQDDEFKQVLTYDQGNNLFKKMDIDGPLIKIWGNTWESELILSAYEWDDSEENFSLLKVEKVDNID